MNDRSKVVAAIDFGTFGSGYAWAITSPDGDYIPSHAINCNDYWSGATLRYPKNRSAILLDSNGNATVAWGYDALNKNSEDSDTYSRYADDFKMLLGSGRSGSDGQIGRNETGRSPEYLITSYLRKLYAMAREHISQAGHDDARVSWYLTVPAIWSDVDRQIMRRLALDAGFPSSQDQLSIVLEPEVAALYCMANESRTTVGRRENRIRQSGARILVVDCGGGTNDIVPLTRRADGTFDQIGQSSGDTYGASRVTGRFILDVLTKRLGLEAMDVLSRDEPYAAKDLINKWEQARNVFDPAQRTPVRIELSMKAVKTLGPAAMERLAAAQNGEGDIILVSPEETITLLDTSVTPICNLVDDQLSRLEEEDPHSEIATYLVGGFANSQYLQRRLENMIGHRAALYVPPRPENAVLFGAVQFGNRPARIRARTMRRTYGFGLNDYFDSALDNQSRRFVDPDGKILCAGRLRVLARLGDLVPSGKEVTTTIYPHSADQSAISLSFYDSQLHDPRYVDDLGVAKIGTVKIILPDAGRQRYRARDRAIDVLTIFGETTIRVQAVDHLTGFRTDGQIDFGA